MKPVVEPVKHGEIWILGWTKFEEPFRWASLVGGLDLESVQQDKK